MPELPEVEIVKRSLFKMINKAKIIDIKINNKNLRYKIPNTFSKHLIGEKILSISRKSKYFLSFNSVLHFGQVKLSLSSSSSRVVSHAGQIIPSNIRFFPRKSGVKLIECFSIVNSFIMFLYDGKLSLTAIFQLLIISIRGAI